MIVRLEPAADDEVRRETYIDAPPERVFEFFTDAEKVAQWWGSGCEIDPRPGGIYRVEFLGGRACALGEFVEVVPNRRIVHTWGWESDISPISPGESVVEITLTESGKGTTVTVRHYGLRGSTEFHGFGWDHYLPRLGLVARGEDPGVDRLGELISSYFPGPSSR